MVIEPVAHLYNDYVEKFGIPRQSLRVPTRAKIVFVEKYRVPEALREIDHFSHLWLLFDFSQAHRGDFSPTVRPPRLGGNRRVGVFASRSPFRPNSIGLSAVRLLAVEKDARLGHCLIVEGADLLNGTPIYDIKPYLAGDSIPQAVCGYADEFTDYALSVDFPPRLLELLPPQMRTPLVALLREDPRPSYQEDNTRVYRFRYGNFEIGFSVDGDLLRVLSVDAAD